MDKQSRALTVPGDFSLLDDEKKIVIKLGGSLISVGEGEIDETYLKKFTDFIKSLEKHVEGILIIVGGGKIVRKYQHSATNLGVKHPDDLDSIGRRLTQVNAELVRSVIGRELAGENIFEGKDFHWTSKVIIGAGWGQAVTSDYNGVKALDLVGTKRLVRLSNIDFIYTADPKIDKDAKPIEHLTWKQLQELSILQGNSEFRPGMNVPFDPKATELAKNIGVKMGFIYGDRFDQVVNFLMGKKFVGTYIG